MRRGRTILLLVLGAALVATLFLLLRPDDDEEEADRSAGPEPTTAMEANPPPTATEADEPEPEPPPPTLRVSVTDGRPVGGIQRLTVEQGERVRIVVRADVSDHVHLHGYDVMRNVGPGRPAQLLVDATIPGRFEIELEDRHLVIAELEVMP